MNNISPAALNNEAFSRDIPRAHSRRFSKKTLDTIFIVVMLAYPVLQFLVTWIFVNFGAISMAFNGSEYYDEFERVYGFSATPTISQLRPGRYVELEDNLCVEEELIKRKEFVHINNPLFPDEKKTSEVDE
jgi:hypothetical protein